MRFQGNCDEFIIEFKPNGFNRMFGIPASEICDNVFPADDVIGKFIKQLYEQLLYASGVQEMVSLANKFFTDFLMKQKAVYNNDGITRISHQLLSNRNNINISQYASLPLLKSQKNCANGSEIICLIILTGTPHELFFRV